MLQHLKADLNAFHALFSGSRCSGAELEELIVRAIQSDTRAQHHPRWQEAGHDDLADIRVDVNGDTHLVQVKSGKISKQTLTLSGHRLSRFDGDFRAMTGYLNANSANIITVPYRRIDDEHGRKHLYSVCYVDIKHLTGLSASKWTKHGAQFVQTNNAGVHFTLSPSMSWQVWWRIPVGLAVPSAEFVIG